jgi:hypothetical protein
VQGLLLILVVLMVLEAVPDIAGLWSRLCGKGVEKSHARRRQFCGGLISWWERAAAARADIAMLFLNAGTVRPSRSTC